MMIKINKIHHVGLLVKDLEKSISFWSDVLGLPLKNIEDVPSHQVKVAFLRTGESDIELVARLEECKKVQLEEGKKETGLDHLCVVLKYVYRSDSKITIMR